jgi:hypothetical protein
VTEDLVIQFVDSLEKNNFAVIFTEDGLADYVRRAIELFPNTPADRSQSLLSD